MQQGVQMDATCDIQQCWELLVKNVASVRTQLYPSYMLSNLPSAIDQSMTQ